MTPGITKVFIVRPFGVKEGVNFDTIDDRLIRPAIERANFEGFTTSRVIEAGNIREDMFGFLVTADIVVADLSIHNANVFYELGVRHGLRPRATVMIRAQIGDAKHPFDLQTDRYLVYDWREPAKSVDELANALKATRDSDRTDSPVYQLLPKLRAPDPATLKVVPQGFAEEVDLARRAEQRGDLRLRAHEARWFDWASEGLRAVGLAQFGIKAFEGAKETFEWLREIVPDDVEANLRLATIYHRLEKLGPSALALGRVIRNRASSREQLAEAFALRARNLKAVWSSKLEGVAQADLPEVALRAPELSEAERAYAAGFAQDLNAFYPGLNALSLMCLRIELAQVLPAIWTDLNESEEEAQRKLVDERKHLGDLAGAVRLCLKAKREFLERQANPDAEQMMWLAISEADLEFLTGDRPGRVAQRYRAALSGAPPFAVDAAAKQLDIFNKLGVRSGFVREALKVVGQANSTPVSPVSPPKHVLLFTGHMVDAPGRSKPRFPNTKAAQAEARRMIGEAVEAEKALHAGHLEGLAGGACGGDILFHEVCAELGVGTSVYLALPPDEFAAESVVHGGPDWVERYRRLRVRHEPAILAESEDLPSWLRGKADYSIWQRNNLWMLFNALAKNPASLTLIALWNRDKGDGPGGTGDLVVQAEERGQKVVILQAGSLAKLTD